MNKFIFLRNAMVVAVGMIFTFPPPLFSIPDQQAARPSMAVEEVSLSEDLMREHGVLNRLLLIYQEVARRIDNHEPFSAKTLKSAAEIVKNFVEDYHEKLEEDYLFPKFVEAGKEVELVETLKAQHTAGRHLTDYILSHSNEEQLKDDLQKMLLSDYLQLYIRMFRPHEAREDTVLFPKFKHLISKEEYTHLGELFEDREHEQFGERGFDEIVNRVGEIEKELGIYNLNQFTPTLK
jgi:hemerythrin-like domain-containing protein